MPIVFIHGVANRDSQSFAQSIEPLLRKYVAKELNPAAPDSVSIEQAYWGDIGAHFAFDRISRPRTQLLGQGANDPSALSAMALALAIQSGALGPLVGGSPGGIRLVVDFDAMPVEQQTLLLYQVLTDEPFPQNAALVRRIEEALISIEGKAAIGTARTTEEKVQAVAAIVGKGGPLVGQGPGWLEEIGKRVKDTLRAWGMGALRPVGVLLGELRPAANDLLIRFFGDIFEYYRSRSVFREIVEDDGITNRTVEMPGPIMKVALDKLRAAQRIKRDTGERLVVMTHSMGGQIMYDAVTYFVGLDEELKDLEVDFWAAAACQVPLFEELRLNCVSDPSSGPDNRPVAPSRVRYWWSVWDQDDWLSYTGKGIFETLDDPAQGKKRVVRDELYDGKLPFPWSHSGYPVQDRFYQMMVERMREAT